MANRSTFLEIVDVFDEFMDLLPSELVEAKRLKELKYKTSRTATEDAELNTLLTKYKNKILTAEIINKVQDALSNLENFYKNDVENVINESKTEALAAIDVKLQNINTYLDSTTAGALRTDLGVLGDLLTEAKSSLVSAINEIYNKIPEAYVHPTTHAASMITLADAGNIITATNVESALQEIMNKVNTKQLFTGNFNGTTGAVFSHTKGDLNYHVNVTPTENPNGYLGEIWIEYSALNFKVCCSGSAITSFSAEMVW
jgi:hypothetical protein